MSKRIFVTGMGIITSIGTTTEEHLDSILSLKSGIGKLELFSSIHAGIIPVGEIKLSDAELCKMAGVKENSGYTRTALIAILATKEALASAQITNLKEARTGLISSTTVGGMREFENILSDLTDLTKDGNFRNYAHVTDAGEHTERVADLFGFRDYVSTTSTACSSASNAIILGAELIKHGQLDRVVCGGSDVLSKFTLNGFNSLMILDKQQMRPFDAMRGGVNLGEGAAYVVIESEEMVQKFNKKPLAELTGYSNSNDAFHQTASSPNGDGALLSMTRALEMAGVKPADVDYINCHGTATENNDLSEALAIQNLFKEKVPHFGSTKPYTGHTLAAAGSVEAVFAILCIQNKVLFPNLNFENQMPEISIAPVKSLLQNVEVKHVLSNSFGFGGSNTSLLFSKV